MKKFEVGKFYTRQVGKLDDPNTRGWIEIYQCTKIINSKVSNDKATFNLVGLKISDYGERKVKKVSYFIVDQFIAKKPITTIRSYAIDEIAYNKDLQINVQDEVEDEYLYD